MMLTAKNHCNISA